MEELRFEYDSNSHPLHCIIEMFHYIMNNKITDNTCIIDKIRICFLLLTYAHIDIWNKYKEDNRLDINLDTEEPNYNNKKEVDIFILNHVVDSVSKLVDMKLLSNYFFNMDYTVIITYFRDDDDCPIIFAINTNLIYNRIKKDRLECLLSGAALVVKYKESGFKLLRDQITNELLYDGNLNKEKIEVLEILDKHNIELIAYTFDSFVDYIKKNFKETFDTPINNILYHIDIIKYLTTI